MEEEAAAGEEEEEAAAVGEVVEVGGEEEEEGVGEMVGGAKADVEGRGVATSIELHELRSSHSEAGRHHFLGKQCKVLFCKNYNLCFF